MSFEYPRPTLAQKLRAIVFNIVFYVNLIVFMVVGFVFYFTPRIWSIRALQTWARSSLWWLKVIVGTKVEVRGHDKIPHGPVLLVGKHQSLWDTFAILPLVDDPAMVLKRELTYIPLFGWFALKFQMLAVDRGAAAAALRKLVGDAQEKVAQGRQIVIFPEGTRVAPGAKPDYKPGAAALYMKLDVPTVAFGLNSGLYWPRRQYIRYPGTIIIQFADPIAKGLDRRAFTKQIQSKIETVTNELVAEGKSNDFAEM